MHTLYYKVLHSRNTRGEPELIILRLLLLSCSKQNCGLGGTVVLPTCMQLSICSYVHGNAYRVLRPVRTAGPVTPRHQHVSALILTKQSYSQHYLFSTVRESARWSFLIHTLASCQAAQYSSDISVG